jgi:predicted nucleic acid-binding protein
MKYVFDTNRNLILLTNNTGEFQRVKDLKIEDWTL